MIDANATVIGSRACERHAKLIDGHTEHSLAAEWEVAVIYGLSHQGRVAHERGAETDRKVDIHFKAEGRMNAAFSADIVCVSNKGIVDDNPVDELHALVSRVARKAGFDPGKFGLWIEGGPIGERGKQKMRAFVPRGDDQTRTAERYLKGFMSLVQQDPSARRSGRIAFDDVNFNIGYHSEADGRSAGGVHLGATLSVTRNPLARALKDKAKHLKASGSDGLRGVIVCDGGAAVLESEQWRDKTVDEFFRVHSSIDFVMLILVERKASSWDVWEKPSLTPLLYWRDSMPQRCLEELWDVWADATATVPPPINDARNAFHLCYSHRQPQFRALSHCGGWTVKPNSIKVSATEVLSLLAGEISTEEFQERNRLYLDRGRPQTNPFRHAFDRGRMIVGVTVEKEADIDDDWLVFELSDPDPARSGLTAKTSSDRDGGAGR